jgi:ABC-type transport system, involved in lipoprotein release, permease component
MIEFLKSAFKNIGRKRSRTTLTVLGIAIGVASVVIIGNISQCGTSVFNNEMDSLGMSGLSIASSAESKEVSLNENDLELVQKDDQVEQAAPVMVQTTDVSIRNLNTKAIVWGIDTNASQIISINLLYGRMFNQLDINSRSNVCLVDEAFSKSAYFRSNIVGKKVSILCGGVMEEFKIIGIIKTGTGLLQNMIGDYVPTFIYVPYTTVQSAAGRDDFDQIAVKVKQGGDVDSIGKALVSSLNRSNGTTDAFVSNNLARQKDGLANLLNIVTLILSAVGGISLLVASLSIMTVMLVSVNERTREIGIKKAIGAKRSSIMIEFMFEAVLISVLGCIFGLAAGYLVSYAGAAYFGVALSVRTDIMLTAILFSVVTGTAFGVYPAYKASCLKPVDALRQE